MRAFLLRSSFCLLLLSLACGNQDHSTAPSGTPPGNEPVNVAGSVRGPRDPVGLAVRSVYDSTVVAADGGFALKVMPGRQVVTVVDPAVPDIVYMGLLDGGHSVLDSRSTAEVLLYEALGGPFFLGPVRETMLDDPAFAADVDTLAAVIRDGYAAGAASLRDLAGAIRDRLATLPLVTAGREAGSDSTKALVNPPGGRSGIDLDTTAPRRLVLRNNYRRRVLAWVDRAEGVDGDGNVITYGDQVQELDLSPATAYTNVIGTLIDAINGNYLWAPVASPAIPLELRPADGRSTTYDVWVLGLGGASGDYASLSPARQDRFAGLAVKSVFIDFVLPIVTNVAIPVRGEAVDDFLVWAGGSGVLSDFLGTLANTVPSIAQKALAGDLQGAIMDAFNAIASSNTVALNFYEQMARALQEYLEYSPESWDMAVSFADGVGTFLAAMGYVDILGTVMDSALQVRHIAASDVADHWQVTVFPDKLTLDPRRAIVAPGHIRNLTVTVQDAGNRTFAYHWHSNLGGMWHGYGQIGRDFTTSLATVGYQGDEEGEDEVTVEVFEIQGTDRVRIGEASAAVTVKQAVPFLAPRRVSLQGGDRQVFTVRMEHGWEDDTPLFYRWRGGDRHGEQDGSDFIGTRNRVTYHALSDGVDSLFCDVFMAVNGEMQPLGTAAAEIRVEEEPTILFATFVVHEWEDSLSHGTYGDVVWNSVPGGTSYDLYGYGGYDYAYYLAGPIVAEGVDPDHQYHDHVEDIPPGEIWLTLSAGWGPPGSGDGGASLLGRFGSGWIWEVTVHRSP